MDLHLRPRIPTPPWTIPSSPLRPTRSGEAWNLSMNVEHRTPNIEVEE